MLVYETQVFIENNPANGEQEPPENLDNKRVVYGASVCPEHHDIPNFREVELGPGQYVVFHHP